MAFAESGRELPQALDAVDALRALDHDWDSYGANRIDPRAIEAAKQVLVLGAECSPDRRSFPQRPYAIAPLASGGVQLAWRTQRAELEVTVGANGRISILLVRNPGDAETYVEDLDVPVRRVLRFACSDG